MRPGPGIDQDRVHAVSVGLMNALAHRTFAVGLKVLKLGAKLMAQSTQAGVDLVQRDGAVLGQEPHLAIGDAGSANAGLFAVALLALGDKSLADKLTAFRRKQTEAVKNAKLPD